MNNKNCHSEWNKVKRRISRDVDFSRIGRSFVVPMNRNSSRMTTISIFVILNEAKRNEESHRKLIAKKGRPFVSPSLCYGAAESRKNIELNIMGDPSQQIEISCSRMTTEQNIVILMSEAKKNLTSALNLLIWEILRSLHSLKDDNN